MHLLQNWLALPSQGPSVSRAVFSDFGSVILAGEDLTPSRDNNYAFCKVGKQIAILVDVCQLWRSSSECEIQSEFFSSSFGSRDSKTQR